MGLKFAVVGATGQVGLQALSILAKWKFSVEVDEVVALASRRSAGGEVAYGGRQLKVRLLDEFDFTGTDIAFFAAGADVAREWAPRAVAAGAFVIDKSSAFRSDKNVPIVVPEVNPLAIKGAVTQIIATPNCSTTQLVLVLKPLHDKAKIKRVVVSTYQSVSGAGNTGIEELDQQTKALRTRSKLTVQRFPKQIAQNVIPQIDDFRDDGSTGEEQKMVDETKRILDESIQLIATCVRVPVRVGHSEAVNIEFERPISWEEASEVLRKSTGIEVVDERENGGFATPLQCEGRDETFVSRIRKDSTVANGIAMWIVSDNLRKGAALNAIQIAELLIQQELVGGSIKARHRVTA